jgi:hypothetical protein
MQMRPSECELSIACPHPTCKILHHWARDCSALSLFPFPVQQLGVDTLLHFLSIVTLAEAVDVILLDTLSPLEDNEYYSRVGSKGVLAVLDPRNVARRLHEGLNRAIPLIQGSSKLKGVSYSACWSPSEVAVFIRTVKEHENAVDVHGVKAPLASSTTS